MECTHDISNEIYAKKDRPRAYLPNLSAIQQYFSLVTNQRTLLSTMAYPPNEQAVKLSFQSCTYVCSIIGQHRSM
jgi:uncharacterized membrane protein